MALELNNSFEGGSDGTTLTAGNSGGLSGDPFNAVSIGAGGILRFETARAMHGDLSLFVSEPASAVAIYGAWTFGAQSELWARLYLNLDVASSGSYARGLFRFFAGGSERSGLRIKNTRALNVNNHVGTESADTTTLIPLDTWVRIECHATAETGTNNGAIEANLYLNPNSTVADETISLTGLDFGTSASFDEVRVGLLSGADCDIYIDGIQVNNVGYPGPIPGPRRRLVVPPTQAVHRASRW